MHSKHASPPLCPAVTTTAGRTPPDQDPDAHPEGTLLLLYSLLHPREDPAPGFLILFVVAFIGVTVTAQPDT